MINKSENIMWYNPNHQVLAVNIKKRRFYLRDNFIQVSFLLSFLSSFLHISINICALLMNINIYNICRVCMCVILWSFCCDATSSLPPHIFTFTTRQQNIYMTHSPYIYKHSLSHIMHIFHLYTSTISPSFVNSQVRFTKYHPT